ncbi:uncharacterized protein LOC110508937 isoform X2 [Oncorhynchus mykiss]|uniref:uncharacterized protein LOC110508937 isoform X2 n=1 Tax=Oncorhynchus mykiss TaxID=8022 RepID=UPI0018789C9C|nr:uncharacterized protein LOC110508937 isoform X2 [Oncorhynchus mykiss]
MVFENKMIMNGEPDDEEEEAPAEEEGDEEEEEEDMVKQYGQSVRRQSTAPTQGRGWRPARPEWAQDHTHRRNAQRNSSTSYMHGTTV